MKMDKQIIDPETFWEQIAEYLIGAMRTASKAPNDGCQRILVLSLEQVEDWKKEFLGEQGGQHGRKKS